MKAARLFTLVLAVATVWLAVLACAASAKVQRQAVYIERLLRERPSPETLRRLEKVSEHIERIRRMLETPDESSADRED